MAVTPSPTLSPTPEAHAPCKLLGGAFAYFIQLLLGVLALSALFVKRWRERPQRPLKVFLYDAAKQALIALVAHLFNMLVALMLKAQTHEDAAVADEPVEILQNTISDRARRIAQHGSEAHSC